MNDEALIQEAISGSQAAFNQLIEKYQELVVNTCMGFLHQQSDAEDVAQEVFIEMYESLPKFRAESKLSTWLYRIAVNKSLNYLRGNKVRKVMQSIEAFFTGRDDSDDAPMQIEAGADSEATYHIENEERSKALKQAMSNLPKNQRIAFVLNKYDELPYKEIAEVMNTSLSSVESLIHRAKRNLQKDLIHFYKKN